MNRRFYIYALIGLAVIIAGCTGSGKTKTEIVSKDMITIKSIDIFPSKTVQTDDIIVIRMEAENGGQEAAFLLADADSNSGGEFNGDYLLIDHCPSLYNSKNKGLDADFQILSGGTCTTPDETVPRVKDSAGNPIEGCYIRFDPKQSHTFQWTLKAPSASQISELTHKCTFKFQTAYAARAMTNTYVYFADPLELAERLYTKKEMALAGDNIASFGPMAINFVPAEPQPIAAEPEGKWTVFLNLMNVGKGIADVSSLGIALPSGISTYVSADGIDQCLNGGVLNIQDIDAQLNTAGLTPSQKIDLEDARRKLEVYAGGASRIACTLTIPSGVTILTPFGFTTTAEYTYKVRDDIEITTKPVKMA